jgi:Tfp pilus assembly protein PilF
MKILLLIALLALAEFSVFSQTNTAAYDQLMTLAGTFINNGNLDAAKQTAQQVLQLDSQNWRGNALMAAILEKQGDFTNAQIYIQKAIANAPADKHDKLKEMQQTIAASATQGPPAQSTEPTAEETIAWMKKHFADLACDIRVSGPYDGTSSGTIDGTSVSGYSERAYGNKAAQYILMPMSISATSSVLTLTFFELAQRRNSGTEQYSGSKVENDTALSKFSQAWIRRLAINLKSIYVAVSVNEDQDFIFAWPYLQDANATSDGDNKDAAIDAELNTDIKAYQNRQPVYSLVIYGNKNDAISDSAIHAGAAAGSETPSDTTIGIDANNTLHNYCYTNLPSQLSSPPAFWIDPNQDDTDPAAIRDWILQNCHKDLPAGVGDFPDNPLRHPSSIAICNSDENVLEQWRKALSRLIELNSHQGKSENLNTPTYDQLLTRAGRLIGSGDLDEAKQIVQKLLQFDSGRWQGNALMGYILDQQGDFTNADDYISRAIDNAPHPTPFNLYFFPDGTERIKSVRGIVPIPEDAKVNEDSQ